MRQPGIQILNRASPRHSELVLYDMLQYNRSFRTYSSPVQQRDPRNVGSLQYVSSPVPESFLES